MLRDDRGNGEGQRRSPRNVLGEPLDICSMKPMTGFIGMVAATPGKGTLAVTRSAP